MEGISETDGMTLSPLILGTFWYCLVSDKLSEIHLSVQNLRSLLEELSWQSQSKLFHNTKDGRKKP